MHMGKNNGKNSKAALVGQLIAGAKKHFPNGSTQLTLGGAPTTVDGVTSQLAGFVTNRAAVVAAQAAATTKVSAERAAMPALNALIDAFIAFVRLTFGTQADVLADFGLAPPRARTPMTAQQKAVAAAKRQATREARGTTSAKVKKAVHGNITASLVVTPGTPAPAAAPEATPPSPAPQGGSTPVQAKS
jgi:hypothetical protein